MGTPPPAAVKLSVIIPTMNEEAGIGSTLDLVHRALGPSGISYELLIVDTDSKDRTREIAGSKGAIVIDEPRRGYGRAYKTGFERARGELIATLDADATYPAERIPELVRMLESERLDFITGDRFAMMQKGAMSAKHRFGNWVLSTTMRVLFGVPVKDSQSGMWVLRRRELAKWVLTSDGMPMSEEIKIEAFRKSRAKEVGIEYRVRLGEVKLQSFSDGWRNLRFLLRKRFGRT
jgi:hypothetical protein